MTIDDRFAKLELTIAALQKDIAALQTQKQKQDGGEFVLDRLAIRDKEGRERIILGTKDGVAFITHFDANGKFRIAAGTHEDGRANITHFDAIGKTVRTLP